MESEKMSLRILQCTDVLLDGPRARVRRDGVEQRRMALRDAFTAFMTRVREEEADAVLFCGNLLDGAYATDDTLTYLIRAFSENSNCHFIIAPGPRDPYDEQSIYRSRRFPHNVHVFSEEVASSFSFPDLPLTVYGWGYRTSRFSHAPLVGVSRVPTERFTVLCGHALLQNEEGVCPLSHEDVASFGAHYTALGGGPHEGFLRVGSGICSTAGAFDISDFNGEEESTFGSYLRIDAAKKEGGWAIEAQRVPLESERYEQIFLDVSHMTDLSDVKERLLEALKKRSCSANTVLRVTLYGTVSPDADFSGLESGADYGVYAVTVRDKTLPTDGAEHLLREMNARGELYRHFYGRMTEGSEEERERAARQFRIGYAALLGRDFGL